MSEIGKQLDVIISGRLALVLKTEGYKKFSRTFVHDSMDCTRIVNVQASQYNIGDQGSFTLNLGVYFPSVAKLIEWHPIKTYPKEYDCTIRSRIGMLMADRCDKWWTINPETNLSSFGDELLEAWSSYGRPWLAKVSTLDRAKSELIRTQSYFQAAGIALCQQQAGESKLLLRLAIGKSPLAKAKFHNWGLKHNLIDGND